MLSTALYSYSSYIGARLNRLDPNDTSFYDYSQPRIKSLLLNNYDWILSVIPHFDIDTYWIYTANYFREIIYHVYKSVLYIIARFFRFTYDTMKA